jgi:hypothetical protein
MKHNFSYAYSSCQGNNQTMGHSLEKANETLKEYQEFKHSLILSNYPKELLSPNTDLNKLISKKSKFRDEIKLNPCQNRKKERKTILLPTINTANKSSNIDVPNKIVNNNTERILNIYEKDSSMIQTLNDKNFKLKSKKERTRMKFLKLNSESMDSQTTSDSKAISNNVGEKKSKSNKSLFKIDGNQSELKCIPKQLLGLDSIVKMDSKFRNIENDIEVSNKNIKKLIKKYDKKKEEIPFEQQYLIEENSNFNREVFIYHRDSKFERRAFISSLNKNNIYEQSEFIGNTNSESIYKFRNIVFEKYGKGFLNDHDLLKKGVSKN